MQYTQTRQLFVTFLLAALPALIFLLDVQTPLGYAEWAMYIIPMSLTLLQNRSAVPLVEAAVCTVLIIVGYYQSAGATTASGFAHINRGIGITAVWTIAFTVVNALKTRHQVNDILWQQQGESAVAQALLGELTPEQIGQKAMSALCEFTHAPVGVLYRLEGQTLLRCGGHGFDPATTAERWQLPDGLLGEVAVSGQLRHLRKVPIEHLPIASGLGRSPSAQLLIAPLRADGQVCGVIELGFATSAEELGEARMARKRALMRDVGEAVGVAMRSALYRERLLSLLEETQRQSEELQAQQEELRVTNEELEEQSRVLSESQARLETQQVELEHTNLALSEQKASLERQKQHLVQAQNALRTHAEQLKEASRYKSEFLANMSHELRTPLNSALILSRLLADNREGTLTPEQVKYAQTIHAANNDLLALINDVLDLSKIEAGKADLELGTVRTDDLLQRLRATFEPLALQKGVALQVVAEPGMPERLHTDALRLQQVLKNLMANALKFTERGQVSLRALPTTEGRIAFAVQDTGIGIPKSQQEVIFEAFRQADGSTSRRFGGTGLGLSISRELARRLGGDITVDSEPGRGSTFTLDLPVELQEEAGGPADMAAERSATPAPAPAAAASPAPARAPSPAPAAAPAPEPAPPAAPVAARTPSPRRHTGRLVLAVEDDPTFAKVLCELATDLGFDCEIASSGEEALQLARELRPNGILLDVGLPDQSGLTVLERLKRDPDTRHIPVHVVSAHPHVQTARELGAVGYLQKPVDREGLAGALDALQRRMQQQVRRLLIVEDDEGLRSHLQLLLGGEGVEITAVGTIADALAQLGRSTFDCMVMDLALPDGTGYDLLERIAATEDYAFPPVIVYTGRELSRDEEQRLRKHSRSIIVKGARSPERLLDEVTLFLHSVEATLPANQRQLLRQARQRDAVLDGRRILLAEDDVRNIFALSSVFEPLGAKLVIARNGKEALQKLEAERSQIDLVLMDIMMPEMDGLTALRHIREHAEWASLPVIALTAKAMADDRERCLAAGANDYIAKPIDIDKLVSLCRVWMPK
ncbi:response regulator [Aquincola tertiaricarbonis]|uniref:response regulator n=1 Tax=Aquincola tertiaricarbonis TaxID=391953 RepID=UPI0006153278|nr:response regulator [Aquincola tertiaricarbonis]